MLRSTASLLGVGVGRRVVVRLAAGAVSASKVSAQRSSFFRPMRCSQLGYSRDFDSTSTIVEDDGSDYGFGESIPEQDIPEEFIEEGEETIGEWHGCTRKFLAPISVSSRGGEILNNPLFNKGTAFKGGERDRLRFRGLLPPRRVNMKIQKERVLQEIRAETSMIRKHIILEDVHDRNETLYHRVLVDHMEEMAPIIYTPTVGQACKEFAMRYRRPRGMFFCEDDRGHMAGMRVRTEMHSVF